jgi:hypothetical protein
MDTLTTGTGRKKYFESYGEEFYSKGVKAK